jgi:hypothetical protein
MAFPDLIHTPAYEQALRTPDVMGHDPASRWAVREPQLLASYQIREAGFRLDHLIRNALDPNRNPVWPQLWQMSAIKAFVELIEAKLSSTSFANRDEVHEFIDPRLDLAKEIMRRMDEALVKEGYPPISSDGFRQEVAVHGTQVGIQIEDLVFENPLCAIQAGGYGPHSSVTGKRRELLIAMSIYWC